MSLGDCFLETRFWTVQHPSLFLQYGGYYLSGPLCYFFISKSLPSIFSLKMPSHLFLKCSPCANVCILSLGGYSLQPKFRDKGAIQGTLNAIDYIALEVDSCFSLKQSEFTADLEAPQYPFVKQIHSYLRVGGR